MMNREQAAAYVFAQSVAALAEVQSMVAANKEREDQGYALAYAEEAFANVAERFGITHNQVMAIYQQANQ